MTLTCSSDANPAANYTWYKENQTLLQGPEYIYNFISISSEDSGSYHCKSENKYGQINSSFLFIDVQCKYETKHNIFNYSDGELTAAGYVFLCSQLDLWLNLPTDNSTVGVAQSQLVTAALWSNVKKDSKAFFRCNIDDFI